MNIRMTAHCKQRITERLSGLITIDEVQSIVNNKRGWSQGRNNVVIKKLGRMVEIQETNNHWDNPKGDMIIALVDIEKEDSRITNVLLRKSGEYQGRV